jgi:hypothetical protein
MEGLLKYALSIVIAVQESTIGMTASNTQESTFISKMGFGGITSLDPGSVVIKKFLLEDSVTSRPTGPTYKKKLTEITY